MLAVKLERQLPKTEILNRYLNAVYFGRGAYGVEAASKTYFGKDVGSLTLPEAAYLAGLIRSPETADAALPAIGPGRGQRAGHGQVPAHLGAGQHGQAALHHPGPAGRGGGLARGPTCCPRPRAPAPRR